MAGLTTARTDHLASRDFDRIANELRAAADRKLQRRVAYAIAKIARPIGREVLEEGASEMPQRGGLADRVAASKVGVSSWFRGQTSFIAIRFRNSIRLKGLNRGYLRHPVFADSAETRDEWTWVSQSVPGQAFTKALQKRQTAVRGAAVAAAQDVLHDVARSVKG